MDTSKNRRLRRTRAHQRVRVNVSGTSDRPRLAVFKSSKYLYAQIIDDVEGVTLAQASSLEPELKGRAEGSTKGKAAARLVGETIADRAREKGISSVVYDRGGYIYHGRVKEIAEGARSKGLKF